MSDMRVNTDWVSAVPISEFRKIVSRYERRWLRQLRDALAEKSADIRSQLEMSPASKLNRDGSPMSISEYQRWRTAAMGALECTEKQIGICDGLLGGDGVPPLGRDIIEVLVSIAEGVDDLDPDEAAALDAAQKYLEETCR